MVRLIFHPEAKDELREAAERYEESRQGLGREFFDEVRGAAASGGFPMGSSIGSMTTRSSSPR